MNMHERVARFNQMRESGRLLSGRWTDTDELGREMACWLAALSPEVGMTMSLTACPADVMPQALAYLVPWMDDSVSDDARNDASARFGLLASRWYVLDAAAWQRCDIKWRRFAITETLTCVPQEESWGVRAACLGVIAWLDAGAPDSERAFARELTEVAVSAADDAATLQAWEAKALSTPWTASTAWIAALTTNWATDSHARAAAATARRAATVTDSADRIIVAILDTIEAECVAAEMALQH